MDILINLNLLGLFTTSFLAATILPIGSEVFFTTMIINDFNPSLCIIVASIGNWLGGKTNYYLGYFGKLEWIEKYLKISHKQIIKIQQKLYNQSAYLAFFCFLPIVGDIIAIALGFIKANPFIVNFTMFTGKFLRYLVILYGIKSLF